MASAFGFIREHIHKESAMFDTLIRQILEPPAFGLDISDITIKFVRLSEAGKGTARFDYFGEINIPEGIVVSGEIKEEKALTAILKEKLVMPNGRSLRERYCVVSLPEEKSFVRLIELPNIGTEDIARAVRWEVEGVVPLPAGQIFYDYEPVSAISEKADHRDVLVTAFPRGIIEGYHRVIRAAGLVPLALELESQAISRALIPEASAHVPRIIVDIGATRTSFIIFAGGTMLFTKSIPLGGHDFDQAIAASLAVPLDEARQTKINYGLSRNFQNGRVFKALEPHLDTITAELKQQFLFFLNHPAKKHSDLGEIQEVFLCGGDANLIGLGKYIATAVRKMVSLGDPFTKVALPQGAIPPIAKNQSIKYTTAIGLALRAVGR